MMIADRPNLLNRLNEGEPRTWLDARPPPITFDPLPKNLSGGWASEVDFDDPHANDEERADGAKPTVVRDWQWGRVVDDQDDDEDLRLWDGRIAAIPKTLRYELNTLYGPGCRGLRGEFVRLVGTRECPMLAPSSTWPPAGSTSAAVEEMEKAVHVGSILYIAAQVSPPTQALLDVARKATRLIVEGGLRTGRLRLRLLGEAYQADLEVTPAEVDNAVVAAIRETGLWDEADDMEQDPTDDRLALDLAEELTARFRYDRDENKWYGFTAGVWQRDVSHEVVEFTRAKHRRLVKYLDEMAAIEAAQAADASPDEEHDDKPACCPPAVKHNLLSSSCVNRIPRLACSDERLSVSSKVWDSDPWVMGAGDQLVDLQTGQTRPLIAGDMVRRAGPFAPTMATKTASRFQEFLRWMTCNDEELQDWLRRWAGCCLTGDTREQILPFFTGPGRNGKSLFVELIAHLMGGYAGKAPEALLTKTRHQGDRHPTELMELQGRRLVYADELDANAVWREERIKDLTGSGTIKARRMHRDFVEFRRSHKLVVIANARPRIENPDPAMRRRLLVVPFDAEVPPDDVDPRLKEKLLAEGPAILRWAIDGCLAWQVRGLGVDLPARVRGATSEYFEEEDLLAQWVAECCELAHAGVEPPDGKTARRGDPWATATEVLLPSYCAWLTARSEPHVSARALGAQLQALAVKQVRIPIGSTHRRGYWGIRFRVSGAPSLAVLPGGGVVEGTAG